MISNQDGFAALDALIAAAPESHELPTASTDLIPINRESGKPSVNARDLHAFLEVGKVFGAWITDRIEQFDFVCGVDFEVVSENGKNPQGGRPAKEYALSLDMAKELSMVERTDKGKQARQYFIACEKKLMEQAAAPVALPSYPEALRLYAAQLEKTSALETTVSILEPKAEALDRISKADGEMCISNAAKVLQMRPKDLFQWLQANAWIFRRGADWLPYSSREAQGVLDCKITTVSRADGSERTCSQTLVTAKGLAKLAEHFQAKEGK